MIRGIRAEIKVLIGFLESGLETVGWYRKTLGKGHSLTKFTYTGDFELLFLNSNLDKFGLLDEDVLAKIAELRGTLNATQLAMKTLIENQIPSFLAKEINITTLRSFFLATENSLSYLIKLGKEIIDS